MTNDYVNLETAKLLKEAGFREECLGFYSTLPSKLKSGNPIYTLEIGTVLYSYNECNNNPHIVDAPHLYDVAKWIRDIKGIYIYILPESQYRDCCGYNKILFYSYHFDFVNKELYPIKEITYTIKKYDTYEQALDAGIRKACKIIKNK